MKPSKEPHYEVYDIGQRGEFRGHNLVDYWTDVHAGGGDDIIVGSHQGRFPLAITLRRFGYRLCEYSKTSSIFTIIDMEAGETFTTHQNYDQLELTNEFRDGRKQYTISSMDSSFKHTAYVESGHKLLEALIPMAISNLFASLSLETGYRL